jgi:hypothetical protein
MQFPMRPFVTPVVTCMSDCKRGFRLDLGFTAHFNTQLVISLNYRAIADLHTLQITVPHANSFSARSVFTSSYLATAFN